MKRIQQINESKAMLLEGFMGLLEHHAYEKITLSQIAQASGVTRMTLYRHFKTKDEIILFAFEQSVNKTLDHINASDKPSPLLLLEYRFQLLKDSPYTPLLARQNKINQLSSTIGIQFMHHFDHILPKIEEKYDQAFLTGGIDAMTVLWVKSGMQESPLHMAKKVAQAFDLFKQ